MAKKVLPEDIAKMYDDLLDVRDTASLRKLNEVLNDGYATDDQLRYEFLKKVLSEDNEGTLQVPADTSIVAYPVIKAGPRRADQLKIPTTSGVLKTLGFTDDKKDGKVTKTAQEKFVEAYLDHPNALTDSLEEKDKSIGTKSKEVLRRAFREVNNDLFEQKSQAARDSVLSGDGDWNWSEQPWFKQVTPVSPIHALLGGRVLNPDKILPPKAQSVLMSLFMDRQKDAYSRGEDPSLGDYAGDIGGNAVMWVPSAKFLSVAGKIPKVGALVKNLANAATNAAPRVAPKAIGIGSSVAGNSVAPLATEGMQYIGDELDPDREAKLNTSRAILGALTNIGVNDVLINQGGKILRMSLDEAAANQAAKEARSALKGATKESGSFTEPVSQDHLQAYIVNKLGGDRSADFAASGFGISPSVVKDLRQNSKDVNDARYRNEAAEKQEVLNRAQDETDAKYLQMVVDNPDVLKFSNDTGFKMWLVTRGNDLLRGTSYHRPTWEVEF